MDQANQDQRRQYFRLRYPTTERPKAHILGRDFLVCEISERGTRILFTSKHPVSKGVIITGTVSFHDGETIEIEGEILRRDGDELIALLSKGPDLKRMTKEQIYLRKKFPGIFSKSGNFTLIR